MRIETAVDVCDDWMPSARPAMNECTEKSSASTSGSVALWPWPPMGTCLCRTPVCTCSWSCVPLPPPPQHSTSSTQPLDELGRRLRDGVVGCGAVAVTRGDPCWDEPCEPVPWLGGSRSGSSAVVEVGGAAVVLRSGDGAAWSAWPWSWAAWAAWLCSWLWPVDASSS